MLMLSLNSRKIILYNPLYARRSELGTIIMDSSPKKCALFYLIQQIHTEARRKKLSLVIIHK